MSIESHNIAALRDRLALIESTQVNENPFKAGANLIKNFKGGLSGDKARTVKGTYAPGASAAGVANKGGKVVAANPVKTAAAAATVGAVGGATMSGGTAGGAATKPTASSLTPEERKELDALAGELEVHMGKLPELDSLLLQHQQLVSGPTNAAKPGQPPSTAAKPEAGTVAGATKAIPSGAPVNPANPGGATSKYQPTPDEAKAALDNGSEKDIAALGGKERLQQLAGITPQSGAATAPAQSNADSTNTSSSDW